MWYSVNTAKKRPKGRPSLDVDRFLPAERMEIFMVLYEKMYAILCGAASDALDLLESGQEQDAITLLGEVLLKAEDMYVEG